MTAITTNNAATENALNPPMVPIRQQAVSEKIAKLLISTGLHTATGALAAHFFEIIPLEGGAIFGAAIAFSDFFLSIILNKFFPGNTSEEKIVRLVAKFFGSIGFALLATMACGFPITFGASLYLFLLMIPVSLITSLGYGCLHGCVEGQDYQAPNF